MLGYKKFVSKGGGEPAMCAFKRTASAGCGDSAIIPQESPPGDSKANGEIENCINDLKRRLSHTARHQKSAEQAAVEETSSIVQRTHDVQSSWPSQ